MIKDSNDDEHTIHWTIFIKNQTIIRLYNKYLTFARIWWILMCSISFCHSKMTEDQDWSACIYSHKVGGRAAFKSRLNVRHSALSNTTSQGNWPFATMNEDRILLPRTHSVFLFMLDTPFSCRACVSLLLVSFHSDSYGHHRAPVALAQVPCVLAENTSLHSTMGLMSRLKLISVQHFFPQHWRWKVSSSVVASREGNMVRAVNQMLTHAGI